ncbi:MAG: hypothetical protein Q7R43_04965 [Candidatus Daviesbacteria bacterium]|nr:hypothetical protein [Candidatus Daviesbacteria bacterium]
MAETEVEKQKSKWPGDIADNPLFAKNTICRCGPYETPQQAEEFIGVCVYRKNMRLHDPRCSILDREETSLDKKSPKASQMPFNRIDRSYVPGKETFVADLWLRRIVD